MQGNALVSLEMEREPILKIIFEEPRQSAKPTWPKGDRRERPTTYHSDNTVAKSQNQSSTVKLFKIKLDACEANFQEPINNSDRDSASQAENPVTAPLEVALHIDTA